MSEWIPEKKPKKKKFIFDRYNYDHDSESFICGWFIEPTICDALIQEFEENKDKAQFDEKRGYFRVPSKFMNSDVSNSYISMINACLNEYKNVYNFSAHTVDSGIAKPYNLQKYDPGKAYNPWHIEDGGPRSGKLIRHLTFMTYLNDVEEGGKTEFLYQSVDVQPKKGLTLIWPAGWTHPHRGRPAPNETKYIATGWSVFKHRC